VEGVGVPPDLFLHVCRSVVVGPLFALGGGVAFGEATGLGLLLSVDGFAFTVGAAASDFSSRVTSAVNVEDDELVV
jgi:hypothetical protein